MYFCTISGLLCITITAFFVQWAGRTGLAVLGDMIALELTLEIVIRTDDLQRVMSRSLQCRRHTDIQNRSYVNILTKQCFETAKFGQSRWHNMARDLARLSV